MPFLENLTGVSNPTPDQLHAAIDARRGSPVIDQFDARLHEVAQLAPHNKLMLANPNIEMAVMQALAKRGDDIVVDGSVPIVRCSPADLSNSAEHPRNGTAPLPLQAVVARCNNCFEPINQTVPFWIGCGTVIVQIDLCADCADYFVLNGAVLQVEMPR